MAVRAKFKASVGHIWPAGWMLCMSALCRKQYVISQKEQYKSTGWKAALQMMVKLTLSNFRKKNEFLCKFVAKWLQNIFTFTTIFFTTISDGKLPKLIISYFTRQKVRHRWSSQEICNFFSNLSPAPNTIKLCKYFL